MRIVKKIALALLIVSVVLILFSNLIIVSTTEERLISDLEALPDHRVALVLGTSHKISGGRPNPYFETRIEKAAELYRMGKIDHFIVSGDNRSRFYNEPMEMQKALIKLGVPASAITLDYAGLRTLDSIVRCKEIFGQDKIIIITQPFHSYRALFISRYYEIEAVAVVADEPDLDISFKVRIREYLARTKAILDLYILKTAPRFMGEKEELKGSED